MIDKYETIDLSDDELDDLDSVWERRWSGEERLASHIADEFLPKSMSASEWSSYSGPMGGRGWQNITTGEVRYQDDRPDGEPSVAGQARFDFDIDREKKQGERFEDYKAIREFEPSGDLKDDLDFFEFNHYVTPEFVQALLDHYNASPVEWGEYDMDGVYVSGGMVIEWDGEDNTWSTSEVEQFVYDADIGIQVDEYIEKFHDEFWQYPGPVFHATPSENVESIEKNGIGAASETRGMSNRNVGSAVYTTADWDEATYGSYGEAIFEIDTVAMKKDGYEVRVDEEPIISEGSVRESLAYAIGAKDFHVEVESGMSPNTVVFHGSIPAKYIKRVK